MAISICYMMICVSHVCKVIKDRAHHLMACAEEVVVLNVPSDDSNAYVQ